jgi:methionine salvage enolase-phosphatase E1
MVNAIKKDIEGAEGMVMPRLVRNTLFRLASSDVRAFLEENEDRLLELVVEELRRIDDHIEEERAFVDIHMAALGRELMKGVFAALYRFLDEF